MSVVLNNGAYNTQTSGIATPALGSVQDNYLRIPDVDPMFYDLNNGDALLWRILASISAGEPATQRKYEFYEDDQLANKTTVNGEVAIDGTSLTLDDNLASEDSVLRFPQTGENVLVTAKSGSTLTIERSYQGTTAAIIPDGTDAIIGLIALEEGGDAKTGISGLPTMVDNYVSAFSDGFTVSESQSLTDMLNGVGQYSYSMRKKNSLIMRQMDEVIRGSRGTLDTDFAGTGKPAYHTKGLEQFITGGSELPSDLTWYDLNTQFNDAFDETNSSGTKMLFTSSELFGKINAVARDKVVPNVYDSTFGSIISRIQLDSGGMVDLVRDYKGFQSSYGTQGYLLDMPFVELKSLNGMDLIWREVTLANQHDFSYEVYGSTSVCVKLPSLHRKVTIER